MDDELTSAVISGSRRALARAITLVESTSPRDRARAERLVATLPAASALRIGLSGTPGVGKSTFIEAFGQIVTGQGLRLAVLAVDPSSVLTGGSILGDKTRMERLARDPRAYIRPSPSLTASGGVSRRTREAIRLCEAAGFDVVIIETVGVGQSETLVADMTDLFVLLLAPGGGDELQGIKRGIMEVADLILVNKADGPLRDAAVQAVSDYTGALRLLRRRPQDPPGFPKAVPVSAQTGDGLQDAWTQMQAIAAWRRARGFHDSTRAAQARRWFEAEVRHRLMARLDGQAARKAMQRMGDAVETGADPISAASVFLTQLDGLS